VAGSDGERVYTTPRIDKLGVRPGARVAVLGVPDPDLRAELAERGAVVADVLPAPGGADIVLLAADSHAELASLEGLRAAVFPSGAIWVVSRKGRLATLRDVEVIAAARAAGLVDNKVVSFSATHTALRLVVPRDRR
jgi:hypothetical protein